MKNFSPDGSLHDLDTYTGRVAHFFDMVDLRNAFVSSEEVTAASTLLAAHRAGRAPAGTSDRELWAAKKSELRVLFFLCVRAHPYLITIAHLVSFQSRNQLCTPTRAR
jgi:hypothetical protein